MIKVCWLWKSWNNLTMLIFSVLFKRWISYIHTLSLALIIMGKYLKPLHFIWNEWKNIIYKMINDTHFKKKINEDGKSNFLLAVTERVHFRTLYVTLIYFWKQSFKTAFFNPWYTCIHAYGQKTRYTCKCSPPQTVLFNCE